MGFIATPLTSASCRAIYSDQPNRSSHSCDLHCHKPIVPCTCDRPTNFARRKPHRHIITSLATFVAPVPAARTSDLPFLRELDIVNCHTEGNVLQEGHFPLPKGLFLRSPRSLQPSGPSVPDIPLISHPLYLIMQIFALLFRIVLDMTTTPGTSRLSLLKSISHGTSFMPPPLLRTLILPFDPRPAFSPKPLPVTSQVHPA
jgi:hypothetical protein